MSTFRAGEFDRSRIRGFFRPFCPARAIHAITDVDLHGLLIREKKLILLDVDNTIVHWRQNEFDPDVVAWIEEAKTLGFHVAIISNTRKVERLQALADKLGLVTMSGRFKPSRNMFLRALHKFNLEPKDAVMIGDQLFTDVLGANRTGIEAIWVKQSSSKDFIGTKISRMGERFLRSWLYRALVEAETPIYTVEADALAPTPSSSVLKQIVRFAVVGGSSFIIDTGILFFLMFVAKSGGHLWSESLGRWLMGEFPRQFSHASHLSDPAIWIFKPISAGVAILNSFVWNRRWTFEIRGKESRAQQLKRFYIISIGGYVINTVLVNALNAIVPGHPVRGLMIAQVIAAVVAAVWNFAGQRYYAFRPEGNA